DAERKRLCFASSSNFIYVIDLPSHLVNCFLGRPFFYNHLVSTELTDLEDGDAVACMEYLMEKESLIIGTSKGLILLYSIDDDAVEIVGHVDGGVKCISPSPDGGLSAMITGLGRILVMTLDWDVLYEIPLSDVPEDFDVLDDSLETSIVWRGDGKYFASLASVRDSVSFHKKLKVWERDSGALHSASESKLSMGSTLDWTNDGAKIAVFCDRRDERKNPSIVLFEKNGLERSSFSVYEEEDIFIDFLKFSCNSELLAAVVGGSAFDSLKIWYFSNNHWFLKQEIRFSKEDRINFMWDPEKPLNLIIWTISGRIITYRFVWITAVMDNSVAFVVDGSKIMVTPFSLSLIPPPMYFLSLDFSATIRDYTFFSKDSQNKLVASLADGSLSVVGLPTVDYWDALEGKSFKIDALSSDTAYGVLQHMTFLNSDVLLGVSHLSPDYTSCGKSDSNICLREIEIRCSEIHSPDSLRCSGWNAVSVDQIFMGGLLTGMVSNPVSKCSAFIQFEDGKVFEFSSRLGSYKKPCLLRRDDISFASSSPWMAAVPIGDNGSGRMLLFGLDDHGRLQLGQLVLCNNCTTFSFYSNSDEGITHLVLATKQNLLFIVDVGDILMGKLGEKYENFLPVVVKNKKGGKDDTTFISIWEKGAEIVGVLHGDESAVILQTPRGNLECVYPRKLVLDSIMNALSRGRYKDAFLMVRRHRIDFNFIVDHLGWRVFVDLTENFVEQINNLSHITDFVCSIKKENVAETLYRNYVSLPNRGDTKCADDGDDDKVNCVLNSVRKCLVDHIKESPSRELCILTTLAKTVPPSLEEALRRVKFIREMELSSSADGTQSFYPSSEESLKHLLWLSDPEKVFEAALGLYDLNLAAIVALCSQKDPKEFLPFLEELERMPVLLMRYNIDLKLRRYDSALRCIASAGDSHYGDFLALMKNVPELYPAGLELMNDPEKKLRVLEAWGDHLSETKSFEDAATTYMCCSRFDKALKAYRSCGNWSKVLTLSGIMKFSDASIRQLARELSEELQAVGRPADAAKIAVEYCDDADAGIRLMIEARNWEEAMRTAFCRRRDDLASRVKDSAVECAAVLVEEYGEGADKIKRYFARYLAVRQRRLALAATLKSNEESLINDETSSVGSSSSNFSGMSAYTYTTGYVSIYNVIVITQARSRNRQRKTGKIRAGSPNEEAGLVEHLKGMRLSEGAKTELKSLIECLVMNGEGKLGRRVQVSGEKFQAYQIGAVRLCESAAAGGGDEAALNLDAYVTALVRKEILENSDDFSWRSTVLL
ncbi:hypothetical protein M569_04629, partial [Genlisea aurea]